MNGVWIFCLATITIAAPSQADEGQVTTWLSPINGQWEDQNAWDTLIIPTLKDDTFLDHSAAYTITIDSHGMTGSLNISNPQAELLIHDGGSLSLFGDMLNNGNIRINDFTGVLGTTLRFEQQAEISGAGEIELLAAGGSSTLTAPPKTLVTQASTHTIHGQGEINATLNNQGLVLADVDGAKLHIAFEGDMYNSGMLRAEAGAGLVLEGIREPTDSINRIEQGETGVIRADGIGSSLHLENVHVYGGLIEIVNGAHFEQLQRGLSLTNVELNGDFVGYNSGIGLFGTVTHHGRIRLIREGTMSTPRIGTGITILDGTGTIEIESNSGVNVSTSIGGTLTIGPDYTIEGAGTIEAAIVNNGVLRGNHPELRLIITKNHNGGGGPWPVNNGLIEAVDGGEVLMFGVNQSDDAIIRAVGPGSVITVVSGYAINRGTLQTFDGGLVRAETARLANIDLDAHIEVVNRGFLEILGHKPVSNGLIDVNPEAGEGGPTSFAWWYPGQRSVLMGNGGVRLSAPGERAQLKYQFPFEFGLGPEQRLEGIGQIALKLFNEGTIAPGLGLGTMTATEAIVLESSSVFEVEIDAESSDCLKSTSSVELGGALQVLFANGFSPSGYWSSTIIEGSEILGSFDKIYAPKPSGNFVTRVVNTGSKLIAGQTCKADLTLDGALDFFDVSDFLDKFAAKDPEVDFTGDGVFDFFDVSAFLDAFGAGCP